MDFKPLQKHPIKSLKFGKDGIDMTESIIFERCELNQRN